MFGATRIVLERVLLGRRTVSNEENTRENSIVLLGLTRSLVDHGLLIVRSRGNNSNGPLSMRLTPCDLTPANVNCNGISKVLIRVVPVCAHNRVARNVRIVIYRRL